jgi:hypothetical protein
VGYCARHLQEVRDVENLPGILTNQVDRDRNTANKKSSKKDETKSKIPSDSLLGQMLK